MRGLLGAHVVIGGAMDDGGHLLESGACLWVVHGVGNVV